MCVKVGEKGLRAKRFRRGSGFYSHRPLSPNNSPRTRWSYRETIYICVCVCCEVIIWAKFGHFRCYYLGQVGVMIWAKLFLAYKNSGFKQFLAHTVIILCFFCAQLSGSYLKIAFFKKRVQKLGFSILCFKFKIWKFSFLGLLKHYKNRGFS